MAPQNNTKILFVSSHSAKIILSKSASALAGIKAMIPTILAVTAIKKKKKGTGAFSLKNVLNEEVKIIFTHLHS